MQGGGIEEVSTSRWKNKNTITAYNHSMNSSMSEKLKQIISKFPDDIPYDSVIVDFGTGTGILAIDLALHFPNCLIIGTDYMQKYVELSFENLDIKRRESGREIKNINFHKLDSDEKIYNFIGPDGNKKEPYIIFFSSVVHEIYSYTRVEKIMNPLEKEIIRKNKVKECFNKCYTSLMQDGIIIIRDFCGPINRNDNLCVLTTHEIIEKEFSFEEFSKNFGLEKSSEIDSFNKFDISPILCSKIKECKQDFSYLTNMSSVYEYIFHKDFHENWDQELNERYGFWTELEAVHLLKLAGFENICYDILSGEWIKNNRFFNKISVKLIKNENLLDTPICNEKNEDFPQYQILIKAIKSKNSKNSNKLILHRTNTI